MAGLYDDGSIYDPMTGQLISGPQTNTAGPGVGRTLGVMGSGVRSLFPPPTPSAPLAPPQVPQANPFQPFAGQGQSAAATDTNPFQTFSGQGQYAVAPPPAPAAQAAPAGQPNENPNDRYGRLTGFLGGPESNNDPNAVNSKSGAAGQYQFLPTTWTDFLKSPSNTGGWGEADIKNPKAQQAAAGWNFAQNDGVISKALGRPATDEELLAAHLLGGAGVAALAANPTGNAYQTYSKVSGSAGAAFDNNGKILNKDQTGQDAIASAASFYRTGAGQGRTQVAGPGAPTGDPQGAPQGAQQSAPVDPIAAAQAKAQADLANYKPTPDPYPGAAELPAGSSMLALASGLLSGPNFGQGLGKGLQSMLSVDQANRQGQMQMNQLNRQQNQQMMELQRLGIMTGTNYLGLGIKQQTANNGTDRVGIAQQNANNGTDRVGIQRDGLALRQQQADPNYKGSVAESSALGKQAGADVAALLKSRTADEQSLADNKQALAITDDNPAVGPTLGARINRQLEMAGITTGADDLQAAQKALAANKAAYLNSITGGHMGMIRSFAADKFFSQATADLETSPAAARWITELNNRSIEARNAWRDEYVSKEPQDPAAYAGKNFYMAQDKFLGQWASDHQMPAYQSSKGGTAATASAAPNATKGASGTTSTGISYSVH